MNLKVKDPSELTKNLTTQTTATTITTTTTTITIDATKLPTTETKVKIRETKVLIRETINNQIREMTRDSKLSQDQPKFLSWSQELMDNSSSAR